MHALNALARATPSAALVSFVVLGLLAGNAALASDSAPTAAAAHKFDNSRCIASA